MACASFAMDDIEENKGRRGHQTNEDDSNPLIKYYRATTLIPVKPPILHRLLDRQPAAWASVQISSGILSFGLGVVFAVAFGIEDFLLTLFRVPLLTGIMFLVAGSLSNLLYKHPGLLQICFYSNVVCMVVATVGAVMLCVDLAKDKNHMAFKVEIVVLCVTVLDMLVSAVLIFFMHAEKRNFEKKGSFSSTN